MDIRQLEYFRAAAKSVSFSAASKTMYVTPQTVSAAVASLENELGLSLFDRRATGIMLTDFGRKALLHAEGIVEAASDLKMLALDYRHAWEGSVSFAYASASIPQEGPGLSLSRLMDFSNEYPQVNLRVFESSSDACLAALEHHTADIAFVAGKPDGSKFDMTRVLEARFFIAVSESHPLARMEYISFEDLEGVEFFPPPDLNYSVRAISEACEKKGFSPRFALASFSVENAREFVRSGKGIDFAPEHLARNDKTPGIAYRPLASRDDMGIGLYLVRLATGEEKPAARLLWSYIESLCNRG
ncbi:MAG: LysR family transcriptional regulator [Slackia sp.]